MDAKAVVKVGEFSRGGQSHVVVHALDHDYQADAKLTPVGVFLPEHHELHMSMVTSQVTADCLVDQLESFWELNRARFASVDTLLLLLDNGPENNSRRTQFISRMVNLVDLTGLTIKLAYYPPYHSKYNPVERCWGVLENHWNGALLDSVDKVLGYARSMRWRGDTPFVSLETKTYENGVSLTKSQMRAVEKRLVRKPGLEDWFVTISPLVAA
jgi:hypothetical protein